MEYCRFVFHVYLKTVNYKYCPQIVLLEVRKFSMTRAQKYSCDLRAELLKEFEAGKGRISEEGKQKIQEKYGLNGRKITCWASDRRKRHGLYDEKKFCKKLWKFVKDHPNCPPSTELQEEFQKVFTNFVKIERIGNTEEPIPVAEKTTEN